MTQQNSLLYERIGGAEGVARLVDVFYSKVLGDKQLREFFKDTSMDKLKVMQGEFFSLALGGAGQYSDIDLRRAHQGRDINTKHFKIFVDYLFETLQDFYLSEDERMQIISAINTYVEEITEDGQAGLI